MRSKEKTLLFKIAEKFAPEENILKAIVYGSRVRGDFHENSDLDILVLIKNKNSRLRSKIIDIIYEYELMNDISISVCIFSQQRWNINEKMGSLYLKSIKKEGIIFYDVKHKRKIRSLKISPGKSRKAS